MHPYGRATSPPKTTEADVNHTEKTNKQPTPYASVSPLIPVTNLLSKNCLPESTFFHIPFTCSQRVGKEDRAGTLCLHTKDFLGMNNGAAYKMWCVVFNRGAGKEKKNLSEVAWVINGKDCMYVILTGCETGQI